MLPDRVSNPGPLTYESDALPIALRGPAKFLVQNKFLKGARSGWQDTILKSFEISTLFTRRQK